MSNKKYTAAGICTTERQRRIKRGAHYYAQGDTQQKDTQQK